MAKGYIYIMTNPAFKDLVKIGFATDVEKRRKDLSNTAVPYEYGIYATYETSGHLEDKKLHKMIDLINPNLRVSQNREFYAMTPEDAYELLEAIAFISGTTSGLKKLATPTTEEEAAKKIKRPPINFQKCGIPVGAVLVFTEDESITVTVADERNKVLFGEELTSLSSVAGRIKGISAVQGSAFFTYNGKLITEIAEETQWKE